MNKQEILSGIQQIASEDGGTAPGWQTFANKTGISRTDWYPNLWHRWGDAIREAGCQPNEFKSSYDIAFLLEKYIEFIRELDHFPIESELRNKRKNDNNFPSHGAFRQLGSKRERVQKILEYCKGKSELDDIVSICSKVIKTSREKVDIIDKVDSGKVGYVCLIQHGKRKEYKIGRTSNPIRREGEIRLELPEKIQPIHFIQTDDPSGIEKYWHSRFSSKRKEGEWFSLTTEDIKAFKRWRKIY